MAYTTRVIQGIKEQEYNGVRFLVREGRGKVIVTFSAFAPTNVQQNYNYLKDFMDSEYTIISFLDRDLPLKDPRGTYYLDEKFGNSYLATINEIIHSISNNKANIYLVGSSKGGVGALLLGLTYNYYNIYIMAPQCRIATYIKKRSSIILEFMTNNLEMYYKDLDNILVKKIKLSDSSLPWNIHILCGAEDKYHLLELEIIDKCFWIKDIMYHKVIVDGAHDAIAIAEYRRYLQTKIPIHGIYN